jgi:hypothetical protein
MRRIKKTSQFDDQDDQEFARKCANLSWRASDENRLSVTGRAHQPSLRSAVPNLAAVRVHRDRLLGLLSETHSEFQTIAEPVQKENVGVCARWSRWC